nr:hypothetical protein Iba_chr01bCG7960 [Ipomoea batatas]
MQSSNAPRNHQGLYFSFLMIYTFSLYNLGAKDKLKPGMSSTKDPFKLKSSRLEKCPRPRTVHDRGSRRGLGHLCAAFRFCYVFQPRSVHDRGSLRGFRLSAIISLSPLFVDLGP